MTDAPSVQGPFGASPPHLHRVAPFDFFPEVRLVDLKFDDVEVVLDVLFRGRALRVVAFAADIGSGVAIGERASILADQNARVSVRRLQEGQ